MLDHCKNAQLRIFSGIESGSSQPTMPIAMQAKPTEQVSDFLVRHLPRDLVMSLEDALTVAALRAVDPVKAMNRGHRAHALGQLRHFNMNEAFHGALAAGGAEPTPIAGNSVVTGQAGALTLGRFNIPAGAWMNGRRSQTRRQLARANAAIERLVHGDLFAAPGPVTEAVAFFVGVFSGSALSVEIAVPDRYMKNWIFREGVQAFLQRYEADPSQVDLARPRLKPNAGQGHADGTAGP